MKISRLLMPRQWNPQQLSLVGQPNFARIRINPKIAAAQNQFRQLDKWSENKIPGVVSPQASYLLLLIGNCRPVLIQIACRLQLATKSFCQWKEFTLNRLNYSGFRIKQTIDRAQSQMAVRKMAQ